MGDADSRTSDIGHWFGMTDLCIMAIMLQPLFLKRTVSDVAALRLMMFRLRQNDVARFAHNDVMFAPSCPAGHIMCDSTHHARRVHHLPDRANIIQKSHFCQKTKVGFLLVDDTRLELVTSRTSSGCATSCANRPFLIGRSYSTLSHRKSQELSPIFSLFYAAAAWRGSLRRLCSKGFMIFKIDNTAVYK